MNTINDRRLWVPRSIIWQMNWSSTRKRITYHQLSATAATSINLFQVDLASDHDSWEWGADSTTNTVINKSTSPNICCYNPQQIHSHFWPNNPSSITTAWTVFHNEYNHLKHCLVSVDEPNQENCRTQQIWKNQKSIGGASTQQWVPGGKKTNPASSEPWIDPSGTDLRQTHTTGKRTKREPKHKTHKITQDVWQNAEPSHGSAIRVNPNRRHYQQTKINRA
jgi:hypothetical protein